MSSDLAVCVANLAKRYQLFDRPRHRLMQPFLRKRKLFREFNALHGLTFEVRRGETLGIIGRNGSGKSTLLQIIAGTLTPTAGRLEVNGRIAALLELGSGFDPEFTGRENVFLNGSLLGIPRAEMARRFDDILAFADIGAFIDQPVRTYSSGMMVRLAFSVSVNVEPDILIVDEALSVGDAAFQFKCLERTEQITASGTTLLLVSHDMSTIKTYCDQVIYLKEGRQRATGLPDAVVEQYLMDARDEQTRSLASAHQVVRKAIVGRAQSMAFGTDQGRIIRAEFESTRGPQAAFMTGEQASLLVEVEFTESVSAPHLVVMVQSRKRVGLGGRVYRIESWTADNELCRARLLVSFAIRLGFGRYFITVRLEDRGVGGAAIPVDKQAGALMFDVMQPDKEQFVGMLDLGIEVTEQGAASETLRGEARIDVKGAASPGKA